MTDPVVPSCVLVVADSDDVGKLVDALSEPLPTTVVGKVEVVVTGGGDDAIDVFAARRPPVVVVCATLVAGDAASLIEALRGMVPRTELAIVVIGDREGPASIPAGVAELSPDAFVGRPIVGRALRYAVANSLERVMRVRGIPASSGTSPGTDPNASQIDALPKSARLARWEALADSLVESEPVPQEPTGDPTEAAPLPPQPAPTRDPWADPSLPPREPTMIIQDLGPTPEPGPTPVSIGRTTTGDDHVDMSERRPDGEWSEPMSLSALADRDSKRDLDAQTIERRPSGRVADEHDNDILESALVLDTHDNLDDFDDDLVIGNDLGVVHRPASSPRIEILDDTGPPQRDFARQLRAKMSMMAQRLFQGSDGSASGSVDLGPRHDHHTEIDLAALGEETPLGGGVTEIESRASRPVEPRDSRDSSTSPGSSWDTQLRERGLPDGGEIVRGVSDAPLVVARMFATGATGRMTFRRPREAGVVGPDGSTAASPLEKAGGATGVSPVEKAGGATGVSPVEKIVFFDQGRPVFASSSEPRDRMGELLVREGKITASQYERCQAVVAESGRRMGEILVDFGYLKRRELLPAVRRHVEDIVYSLFGWERGQYLITIEGQPSAERIRLSRHPAALVLEGIRRKLDRSTLERLIGPPSTIIEVGDRDRVNAVINTGNTGDLGQEERAALAAIDGQADLAQVARTAGVDLADVLPLAWGLCVLGLATARRTDTEVPDESTALVGETDLAIDRERVRARWQLVTEADYFALLGVRRDATAFEIRRAYQSARRDFSSDTFPADLRRELAQELDDIAHVLDEAFRVLRDDRLRGTYLSNLIEY